MAEYSRPADAPPLPPDEWGVPQEVIYGAKRNMLMSGLRNLKTRGHGKAGGVVAGAAAAEAEAAEGQEEIGGGFGGMNVLGRATYSVVELLDSHPLKFTCENKSTVYEKCLQSQTDPHSTDPLIFLRTQARPLPSTIDLLTLRASYERVQVHAGVFQYERAEENVHEWHMNFADKHLFGYWSGALFAQDEMQVLEHPVLAALQLELLEIELRSHTNGGKNKGLQPYTRDGRGATPCLVQNVPRLCAIDTAGPTPIYGNAFAQVSSEAVLAQTSCFGAPANPVRLSNILALEAPKPSQGTYTLSQIADILTTAYSGYLAARAASVESSTRQQAPLDVVRIHTGHWGCGAYGKGPVHPLRVCLRTLRCPLRPLML